MAIRLLAVLGKAHHLRVERAERTESSHYLYSTSSCLLVCFELRHFECFQALQSHPRSKIAFDWYFELDHFLVPRCQLTYG